MADPQAETAARLVRWITASTVSITPHDVHMARVAWHDDVAQLAGLVLMLAIARGSPRIVVAVRLLKHPAHADGRGIWATPWRK
jgi:hypothetical protein